MSDTADASPRTQRWQKILRGLATLALFVVLAPLIGWLIAVVVLALRDPPNAFLNQLPLSLAFGYVIGIVPAAAAGFIVAVRDVVDRPVTRPVALAMGGAIGAVWGFYIGTEGDDLLFLGILVFVASVVATMACWWLSRRFIVGSVTP